MTLGLEAPLLIPITALLPLTALLLVSQSNPYQTLVMRGILGAVAALIYALLGAADVALTEALVGTLLSTTLYAVALRSSMVLRVAAPLGLPPEPVVQRLRAWLEPLHLRLELIPEPQPGESGLHGVLSPAGAPGHYTLRLQREPLHTRLAALPGAGLWQADGHGLELVQPAPGAGDATAEAQP